MKQILRNISLLSVSILISIGTTKAQSTIIFEQNGASNQFVNSQWSDMCTFCFANPDKITISSGESGTLSINNTNKYKNIKVELHFDHALNNTTFTFDLNIKSPSSTLSKNTVYCDATTGNAYAYSIIEYNNGAGFEINKMIFSNPSEAAKITYIKITGEQVSSLSSEELNAFDVKVTPENIVIDSKMDGTLNVYNALGQIQGTYSINKGENTLPNSTKGMIFLVLADTNNKVVTRKKIMR